MKKPWLLACLVLAVLADLAFTYAQNLRLTIDGDLAAIVVPRADYAAVLHDPLGLGVLLGDGWYAAPNRFFSHLLMREYCLRVPLALQAVASPIASVYAAMALLNVLVQALLLYVLGWYASGTRRLSSLRLWLAMALMVPFFQTTGYTGQMAIVDNSFTYNFFYAIPLLLLLLLLWPLHRAAWRGQPLRLPWYQLLPMLLLSVVLALSGPIIGGAVLVLLVGLGLRLAGQRWQRPAAERLRGLPWPALAVCGWLGAWCVYSLYIGRHNTENLAVIMPVLRRYQLVPYGIYDELTMKLGLPLLVLACLLNAWVLRRAVPATPEAAAIGRVLRWVGWFALVYVALLPLGGYRPYRPLILRHDSIMPVTIALVGFYALSASYLLRQLRGRARRWFGLGVAVVAFVFMYADRRLYPHHDNAGERRALAALAKAGAQPVVRLPEDCTVLSWETITNPSESVTNAELLHYWGITPGQKLYYYPAQ
ncbi:MAG TPA: hypothetical protein VFO93_01560 [Hymenobacter sp.]|uniref:hypothetical protein n=1 Tax=Hymenobacter sp. TaxID=1898978 RepID=UPI002D7E5E11|nr:hypothetical protein [Hymenobacter sp.]HET9502197.1 hypothetical protein [Hymenobacter sp.]